MLNCGLKHYIRKSFQHYARGWDKNYIDNKTLITDSYGTTKNVRQYFEYKFDEPFKFDRDFMY